MRESIKEHQRRCRSSLGLLAFMIRRVIARADLAAVVFDVRNLRHVCLFKMASSSTSPSGLSLQENQSLDISFTNDYKLFTEIENSLKWLSSVLYKVVPNSGLCCMLSALSGQLIVPGLSGRDFLDDSNYAKDQITFCRVQPNERVA